MIPVSGWFILFALVLGLVLMAVVLYMDYSNLSVECRDPLILSTNRVVLILGTLMFGSSMTLMYCRWNCGSSNSEWTMAYLIFMLILAIVLIVCGAISNVQGKKVKCKPVAQYSPVIWGIGLIVLIGALFGLWFEYNNKSSEQLEEDIEKMEAKVKEDEAKALEAERRVEAQNKIRQLRARSMEVEDRVKKAKRAEKKTSSEKPRRNTGSPLPDQVKRATSFTRGRSESRSPSPEPVKITTLDRLRQEREGSSIEETSFPSGRDMYNVDARERQREYSERRMRQRRGRSPVQIEDGGR